MSGIASFLTQLRRNGWKNRSAKNPATAKTSQTKLRFFNLEPEKTTMMASKSKTLEQQFSAAEVDAIGKCLNCALSGDPDIPNKHFPSLAGPNIDGAMEVVRDWTKVDFGNDVTRTTVRGVLHNLWGYPHNKWERVTQETGLTNREIKELFDRWRSAFQDVGGE